MSASTILVIGATIADGRRWAEENVTAGNNPVVVSVQHPDSARGRQAVAILSTPAARANSRFQRTLEVCMPCVLATLDG